MSDPTDLKAIEAARQAREIERRIAKENEADDYRWQMSTERGRRLMWVWLSNCGIYRTPFTADPQVTAFNCGAHNIGLMLNAALLEHCPVEYALMGQEAKIARDKHTAR